jgi:hAT family C-terminal dimerisation region
LLGLHTPNLDDEDAISFQVTLEKIREVAKAIRSSPQRWDKFQVACRSYSIAPVTIPIDVSTRWSSTYDMGEQYLYLTKPINRFLDDCELEHLKLTTSEFEIVELLVVFLMPFKRCTKRFESNAENPEIDYVFFAYDSLFNHIDDVKTALEGTTALAALPSAPYMLDALCDMEEKFKIYYEKTELPTVYSDAMILNPRCKLSIFEMETWSDEDSRKYSDGCRQRFLEGYHNVDHHVPPDPHPSSSSASSSCKRSGVSAFNGDDEFEQTLLQRSVKRLRTDYDRYLDTPNDIWAQSLPWWRAHRHAFHDLSFMARDNLAVPASGCGVERQFSISRRIVSWERSRLKGETISDSMMFKAGLMRKGLELREMDIAVDEDHDWNLAVPPLTGEVPKEWADGWWLEKTEKTKYPVRPFISNLMLGLDDDDEDIYG